MRNHYPPYSGEHIPHESLDIDPQLRISFRETHTKPPKFFFFFFFLLLLELDELQGFFFFLRGIVLLYKKGLKSKIPPFLLKEEIIKLLFCSSLERKH